MPALLFELFPNFSLNWCVNDNRLFRSANSSVIETRPREDIANCFGCVRGTLDKHRHISGTDTERRFPGGVSRTHETDSPCREYDGSSLVLHQGFSRVDGAVLNAVDCLSRQA